MAASFKDRPIAKIVLAAIGVAIGLFAAKFAFQAFSNRPGNVEAQFEAAVQDDPSMGPMFQALRTHFPSDYEAFKAEMVAQHRAGASHESLKAAGFARMAAFRKSHLPDLAQAPSAELQAYRSTQRALLDQLARESASMCARYSFAALQPTDTPSPAAQKLLADLGTVQFRAMAAGQKNPAKRDLNTPPQQDSEALVRQLKAEGLSERQLTAFLGGAGPASLSETEQCQTGVALSEALGKLPVEQADRITAILVAHS